MNLRQLYYFKKIAELEHYTRAAKELRNWSTTPGRPRSSLSASPA